MAFDVRRGRGCRKTARRNATQCRRAARRSWPSLTRLQFFLFFLLYRLAASAPSYHSSSFRRLKKFRAFASGRVRHSRCFDSKSHSMGGVWRCTMVETVQRLDTVQHSHLTENIRMRWDLPKVYSSFIQDPRQVHAKRLSSSQCRFNGRFFASSGLLRFTSLPSVALQFSTATSASID